MKINRLSGPSFLVKLWFLFAMAFFLPQGYCDNVSGASLPKVIFSNSPEFKPQGKIFPLKDLLYMRMIAPEENKAKDIIDVFMVSVGSNITSDNEEVKLLETGKDTGVFENVQGLVVKPGNKMLDDGYLQVSAIQDTIILFYNSSGQKRALATVVSGTAVDKININFDAAQTAGKPFNMRLSAQDAQGGGLSGYNGALSLRIEPVLAAGDKAGGKLFPEKTPFFKQGSVNVSAVYSGIGQFKIIAQDLNNPGISGTSEIISFMPAKLKIEAVGTQIVGKEFDMEIRALNYKDELVSDYSTNLAIRLSDSSAVFKKSAQFSGGVAKIKFVSNEWGEKKIFVCDEGNPGICGESGVIDFRLYRLEVDIDRPSGGRKKFYFDEVFKGGVRALDYQGNEISEYAGVVVFKPVKDIDMPVDCYSRGKREFTISGASSLPFKVEVYDKRFPDARGESRPIELMPAKVKVELVKVKDGRAVLLLKIVDAKGDVVREDNSTVFGVYLTESVADNTAFVAGSRKFKAEGGTAAVTVIDAQSETVTVTANTQHFLETEPLNIVF